VKNPYLPELATIVAVKPETGDTKTFALRIDDAEAREAFRYRPGQFLELSVFGAGEAPFCIASSSHGCDTFDVTVRRLGQVTTALHELGEGAQVGVRGPLGNWFPFDEVAGKHILFVGGGLGLAPLRPQIQDVFRESDRFPSITVLYGARTAEDLIYRDELDQWQQQEGITCLLTVDVATDGWSGNVGVVGSLLDRVKIDVSQGVAFVCGPPIMIRFVVQDLVGMGFAEDDIITTLERHMRCGIGKCNHCMIGDKYVCLDGPVFTYRQMKEMMGFEE
jgi:sulfhydrogenase subunit gamma (sulfur reductase)